MKKVYYNLFYFIILVLITSCANQKIESGADWSKAEEILKSIKAPQFPNAEFNIVDFGAVNDGKTLCTAAIEKAIAECNAKGGGKVVVPAGDFLTGPIHLLDDVNLHLMESAKLKFSTDTKDFPIVLTRFEGVELMNYSPLIYALNKKNIALTGKGTIDGQADSSHWWFWKWNDETGVRMQKPANLKLREMAKNNVPVADRVFGDGYFLRPSFVQFYNCTNILIEGITVVNSPMWEIHPVLSENITIDGLNINTLGPNNDGIDPESCKNVLIQNCSFNTGDDCIAIKSGRDYDGRRLNVPSENIVIRNCSMKDGHGGVVIGSEASGSVRNVFAEDCVMDSPNLDRALRIKTNSDRGGIIENIYMRNVKIGEVGEAAVKINMYYDNGDAGGFTPKIKNVFVDNISCSKSKYAFWMKGYERSKIENIVITNSKFENVKKEYLLENVENTVLENVEINGTKISKAISN